MCRKCYMVTFIVVATEINGLTAQVRDCGVLVPPQEAIALADAIAAIPQQDTERLVKLGRQSVETAWEDFVDEWSKFLNRIIQ